MAGGSKPLVDGTREQHFSTSTDLGHRRLAKPQASLQLSAHRHANAEERYDRRKVVSVYTMIGSCGTERKPSDAVSVMKICNCASCCSLSRYQQ